MEFLENNNFINNKICDKKNNSNFEDDFNIESNIEANSNINNYNSIDECDTLDDNTSKKRIAKFLISNSFKAALSLLYYFIHDSCNIIIMGKQNNSHYISGFGIGMIFINAFGLSISIGYLSGMCTIISNAFGSNNMKLVGKHYVIGRVIVTLYLLLVFVPITIFLSKYIFLLLSNFNDKITIIAKNFSISMIMSVIANLQFIVLNNYLQSMNIFDPGMYISLITIAFYPFLSYFVSFYLDYKEVGIGISSFILNLSNYAILEIYNIKYNPYPESIIGPSNYNNYIEIYDTVNNNDSFNEVETIKSPLIKNKVLYIHKYNYYISFIYYEILKTKHLKNQLILGLASAGIFIIEWIAYDFTNIIAAFMGNIELASNTCFLNIANNFFWLQIGINILLKMAIGHACGKKQENLIRNLLKVSMITSLILSILFSLFYFTFNKIIIEVYTEEKPVALLMYKLTITYFFYSFFYFYQNTLNGYLCGLGKQQMIFYISTSVFFFFNYPLIGVLCFFYGFGLVGMYNCFALSLFLISVIYTGYVKKLNLKQLIENNDFIN